MSRAVFATFPALPHWPPAPYQYSSARGVEVSDVANPRDHSGGRSPF